jgi:hypothetical protein
VAWGCVRCAVPTNRFDFSRRHSRRWPETRPCISSTEAPAPRSICLFALVLYLWNYAGATCVDGLIECYFVFLYNDFSLCRLRWIVLNEWSQAISSRAKPERLLLMTCVPHIPASRELHVGNNIICRAWSGRRGVKICHEMCETM